MNQEHIDLLMKRYIRDIASQDERTQLEDLISKDSKLADELAFERDLYHAEINRKKIEDLRQKLDIIRRQSNSKPVISLSRALAIAASMTILVSTVWWIWWRTDKPSEPQDIFVQKDTEEEQNDENLASEPIPGYNESLDKKDPMPVPKEKRNWRDYSSELQHYQGMAMAINVTEEWNVRGDLSTADGVTLYATPVIIGDWPASAHPDIQAAEQDFLAAMAAYQRKKFRQAETAFQKTLDKLPKNHPAASDYLARLYNNLGCTNLLTNNADGADKAFSNAISLAGNLSDDGLSAAIHQNKAIVEELSDDSRTALASLTTALSLAQKTSGESKLLQAIILANEGWLYHKLGNTQSAQEKYLSAHRLFTGSDFSGHIAHISLLQNMIVLAEMAGDTVQAKRLKDELSSLR